MKIRDLIINPTTKQTAVLMVKVNYMNRHYFMLSDGTFVDEKDIEGWQTVLDERDRQKILLALSISDGSKTRFTFEEYALFGLSVYEDSKNNEGYSYPSIEDMKHYARQTLLEYFERLS